MDGFLVEPTARDDRSIDAVVIHGRGLARIPRSAGHNVEVSETELLFLFVLIHGVMNSAALTATHLPRGFILARLYERQRAVATDEHRLIDSMR